MTPGELQPSAAFLSRFPDEFEYTIPVDAVFVESAVYR